MSIVKGTKLQFLMSYPKGIALTATFLRESGFDPQLIARYKKSNWLEPFGDGAYRRCGDKVDWKGALSAMQEQLKLRVHCGGMALAVKNGPTISV